MLSRSQQILLKRAQRQAGIDDAEYRDALEHFAGVRTSTAEELIDEHLDLLLAYFEAIYWRAVEAGTLQPPCNRSEPFQKPGYWAGKNPRGNTSRDRYNVEGLGREIASLESRLASLGYGPSYCASIKDRVIPTAHSGWPAGLAKYRAALERTLASKQRLAFKPF